jgi:hypothetical protein
MIAAFIAVEICLNASRVFMIVICRKRTRANGDSGENSVSPWPLFPLVDSGSSFHYARW